MLWFLRQALSFPESLGRQKLYIPGTCVSDLGQRPLDDHVEFSLIIVNYRALGTINSLVKWVPFILCIHGSQGLVGEKTLKWAQVLRKKRKELSYYRRQEGSKKVLEWTNHVW